MFSARIKGRALCYASSHSDFHEHLEVTMQVKRAIGKATLPKLPIYNKYMQCVESLHYFGWFVVCIPIQVKALLYGFDPYI